jgi:hypothetical protein
VRVSTNTSRKTPRARLALAGLLAGIMLTLIAPSQAAAQAPAEDPNTGALTFTGSFDVPTLYYFRGIRQETDPAFTMWPVGDLGISLFSGDGGVKSASVNFGVWNSLHTGSSGSDGATGRIHYEMDFYSTLNLGFGRGFGLATTYTAYTSPNGLFDTVNELMFKVTQSGRFAPYGLIAFELDDEGQADLGSEAGTYLELGVGPAFPLGRRATLTVPVKLGFSLSDYYEDPTTGEDESFGFFDVGGLVTVPLSGVASKYGAWNFHAGIDFLFLGNATEAFNIDKDGETSTTGVVALFGIGVTY